MNGYERRKKQKKADIKQAAFSLFQQQGFKDIKIEDIAKQAGVSQVTIYNHFGSKEALFREVVKDFTEQQYEFHKNLFNKDLSFQEKMKASILHKTKEVLNIHPEVIQEMMLNDEELRTYLAEFQSKYALPLIVGLIKEAQRNGEINPNLSEQSIMLYIQLFNNDMLISMITGENGKKLAADIFQMFFYGLSMPAENEG
ncbi:TetR family transcriptional regulator [Fictibacillus phosphorivorans]|uniref:TetR family transcriptional regulator n=1 Tax=Fictibacillus phosphorivorans TaxID=1221500 RepID=A0A165P902_9BACL|nr:TetR/AcrR family transcriptional regulator [Fictibacillus phosphorivorans]KZE69383.1 TetR family transcriptional regulator [Fictibacillus phosphorivorans]